MSTSKMAFSISRLDMSRQMFAVRKVFGRRTEFLGIDSLVMVLNYMQLGVLMAAIAANQAYALLLAREDSYGVLVQCNLLELIPQLFQLREEEHPDGCNCNMEHQSQRLLHSARSFARCAQAFPSFHLGFDGLYNTFDFHCITIVGFTSTPIRKTMGFAREGYATIIARLLTVVCIFYGMRTGHQ